MNTRLAFVSAAGVLLIVLAAGMLLSGGGVAAQVDPTTQQQTIEALVAQRFTQTAVVQQQIALTEAARAAPTLTAAFNATVDAAFFQAITATAAAQMTPPALVVPPGLWQQLGAIFGWGGGPSLTAVPTLMPAPPSATLAPPTPLPANFPTNVAAQVQLAEQVFQDGRMFWIRHTRQIWVMVNGPSGSSGGDWYCFNDTFVEGEAETDPALVPPEGLIQPRRGFGKLWRTHPELKDGLGWAMTPEFELTSAYTYLAGGYVDGSRYVPGPGEHRLTTLYGQSISFFEIDLRGDCLGGTWRITQ